MDGHAAAQEIRLKPGGTRLLIAFTGWGQDKARSAQAGFDHQLTKPLDLTRLDMLLTKLKRRKARKMGLIPSA